MVDYDVVIRGGQVVDGTGNPWFYADVGVHPPDRRIGQIDPGAASHVIDAEGRIVCPGFIDLHTHSEMPLLADGSAQSKVRQGVTLDVVGEEPSVGPLQGQVLDEYRVEQALRFDIRVDWTDFDGYFARVLRQGIAMNVAAMVSTQQVKRIVVGYDTRPATRVELDTMSRLVAKAMEDGAVGLSTAWHSGGPEFLDEEIELSRVAVRYGGYYGTHMGSEGYQFMEELEKMLRLAQEARIHIHIFHLKIRGEDNWGKIGDAIAAMEAARQRGVDLTANHYPYTAIHEPWRRLMPRWLQNMPRSEGLPQFGYRAFRDRVKGDPEFTQYVKEHGDWENIVAARLNTPHLKQYEGKTIAQIAHLRGQDDCAETCFDMIFEEGDFVPGIHHALSEDHVRTLMQYPWVAVASDASAINDEVLGRPHPRNFGTNARVLGKYVREEGADQARGGDP